MSNYENILNPLAAAYSAQEADGSLTFLTLAKEISFETEIEAIQSVLRWCNGHRSTNEVLQLSGMGAKEFHDIFDTLVENGIILDACSLGQNFHENSMYPLLITRDLSPEEIGRMSAELRPAVKTKSRLSILPRVEPTGLLEIISDRKSTRSFGPEPITPEQFSSLLMSMYGCVSTHGAVPSAGGLYPLRIFILLLKQVEGYAPGCYEYLRKPHALRLVHKRTSLELTNFLLDSEGIASEASLVVCVTGELEVVTKKYANRAYRLAMLEAGHVAQNAYLFCAERKLSVVEYGGFNDVELSKHLGLKFPSQPILTTIIVGSESSNSEEHIDTYADSEWFLRHSLLKGESPVIKSLTFSTHHYGAYTMPRYVAHAEYFSADPDTPELHEEFNTSTGAGLSLQEAAVKAMGEAFERQVSGNVRVDMTCSKQLVPYPIYDLCEPAPLHSEYTKRAGLAHYRDSDDRAWVMGRRISDGAKIAAPIDQVFYPVLTKHQSSGLTYHTTSTGVAVHPDSDKAIASALLELIERDAIAVTWYARRSPNKIPYSCWTSELQYRVNRLKQSAHREITFCDISLDSVPVVMCMMYGNSYPHMTTGSAASWNYASAMSKALDEAELMFHSFRGYPIKKRSIDPAAVKTVVDHARLWADSCWSKQLGWLMDGTEVVPKRTAFSMQDLVDKFEPAVIDLRPVSTSGLTAVRVLSNVLMPITFGCGAEHYRHPRVKMLGYEWGWNYPALPHCLA